VAKLAGQKEKESKKNGQSYALPFPALVLSAGKSKERKGKKTLSVTSPGKKQTRRLLPVRQTGGGRHHSSPPSHLPRERKRKKRRRASPINQLGVGSGGGLLSSYLLCPGEETCSLVCRSKERAVLPRKEELDAITILSVKKEQGRGDY